MGGQAYRTLTSSCRGRGLDGGADAHAISLVCFIVVKVCGCHLGGLASWIPYRTGYWISLLGAGGMWIVGSTLLTWVWR